MTKLLSPTNGAYLLGPAPEHLHRESLNWLSELEFYKTEIAFLTKLLDIAFLRITSGQNLDELNVLEKKVRSFREKRLDELHNKIMRHENHLSELDEDVFKKNKPEIDEEHHSQFRDMTTFTDNIKELKKEIFALVETQLKRTKKVSRDFEDGISVF